MTKSLTQLLGAVEDNNRERAVLIRALLKERNGIDAALRKAGAEAPTVRRRGKGRTCGKCGKGGHNSRTCQSR